MNRKQRRARLKRLNQERKHSARNWLTNLAEEPSTYGDPDEDEVPYHGRQYPTTARQRRGAVALLAIWGLYGTVFLSDESVIGWWVALSWSPLPVILTLAVAVFIFRGPRP